MWVQLHNIPLGMMNRVYGEKLEKIIGEILDIDVDLDAIGWGPYLIIKTWVDITKPSSEEVCSTMEVILFGFLLNMNVFIISVLSVIESNMQMLVALKVLL